MTHGSPLREALCFNERFAEDEKYLSEVCFLFEGALLDSQFGKGMMYRVRKVLWICSY